MSFYVIMPLEKMLQIKQYPQLIIFLDFLYLFDYYKKSY